MRPRKISRSAEDLRQMLAVIFLQLRAKDDFQPQVNRAENNFLFERERCCAWGPLSARLKRILSDFPRFVISRIRNLAVIWSHLKG